MPEREDRLPSAPVLPHDNDDSDDDPNPEPDPEPQPEPRAAAESSPLSTLRSAIPPPPPSAPADYIAQAERPGLARTTPESDSEEPLQADPSDYSVATDGTIEVQAAETLGHYAEWLGIRASLSYVGEPECNGIMERWIRTLKEECLYLHDFQTLEEARAVIDEFIERYNREWLIERHGHRTPTEIRQTLANKAA